MYISAQIVGKQIKLLTFTLLIHSHVLTKGIYPPNISGFDKSHLQQECSEKLERYINGEPNTPTSDEPVQEILQASPNNIISFGVDNQCEVCVSTSICKGCIDAYQVLMILVRTWMGCNLIYGSHMK